MKKTYKPDGYNAVSPYFIVDGAQKLIDMLVNVFDAVEILRYTRPDGGIMHAEVQLDDSMIMLSEATETYPQNNFMLHIYVEDVDATYARAMEYGCIPDQEPVRQEGDTDKRGSFKDFAGNTWAIGTQLEKR